MTCFRIPITPNFISLNTLNLAIWNGELAQSTLNYFISGENLFNLDSTGASGTFSNGGRSLFLNTFNDISLFSEIST